MEHNALRRCAHIATPIFNDYEIFFIYLDAISIGTYFGKKQSCNDYS